MKQHALFLACAALVILASACGSRLGKDGLPEKKLTEPAIRVSIAEGVQEGTIAFDGEFFLRLEEAVYRFDNSIGAMKVFQRGGNLVLKGERRFLELPSPAILAFQPGDLQHRFRWNGNIYNGGVTIRFADNVFTLINQLPLELYLAGVVPHEMPSNQADYREAVWAQAIAARSYAFYRLNNPASPDFDIYGDTRDQVYAGLSKSTPISEKAVLSTRGVVLLQPDGTPAMTAYHSTSGGVLELQQPVLLADGSGTADFRYDRTDGEYNDKASPYYRWVETRSIETVLLNLQREFSLDSLLVNRLINVGFTMDVAVVKRSPGGRVEEVSIRVDNLDFTLKGYQVRKVLGDRQGKQLMSSLFFFNTLPDNPEKFFIIGAGAGHGLGMSQWGAIGLALKGYKYPQILSFYYPDLAPVRLYR